MTDREQLPAICWPVPKNNRNGEFGNLEEVLAHLEGEYSGHWLIGRNGMWHSGLHITDTTTPWCALSGQAMNEAVDFPVPYQGEQAVRCMVDGEVVAYRINRDYLSTSWFTGDLFYSASFVLVRHRIQPGETAESGLSFYTLYMHLAPWLAYQEQENTTFKVADGQHLKAYVDASLQWVAAQLPAGTRVTWDTTAKADTMTGSNGRQYALVTLDEPVMGNMSLNAEDRVWTVCDKGNLVPACHSPVRPAWWSSLLPPSREAMQFDTVVCPTPYPIKAGDPVGHLGYFQVPSESGYEKRYQVHIECLTPDDLPRFLSNPEGVGRDTPAFACCPAGIPVYLKNTAGNLRDSQLKNPVEVVMPLSGQVVKDTDGKRYWPGGTSRGLLAEADLRLLSRYDLAGRGFETTEDSPVSFDHLDGKMQPKGLVRHIFQTLFTASSVDPRSSHALVKHNYQRLLDKVDSDDGKGYRADEYRRAVHNQDYRAHLYHLCVKHPSDWYYSSEDPVWKSYFTPLMKKETPEWYRYGEKFLTDIRWMHSVPGMVENPWHMHPLMFLDALRETKKQGWAHSLFAKLLGSVESKNDYTAYNQIFHNPKRTVAKYHTNLTSMTIKQVMETQQHTNVMFATGRFQIIPGTLIDAVKSLKLDVNSLYDEAIQDQIFEEYIIKVKRPAIIAYLEGNGSVEDAIYDWAKEFASAGVRKGKTISKGRVAQDEGVSYYSGDGLNHAHLTPNSMVNILRESKNGIN